MGEEVDYNLFSNACIDNPIEKFNEEEKYFFVSLKKFGGYDRACESCRDRVETAEDLGFPTLIINREHVVGISVEDLGEERSRRLNYPIVPLKEALRLYEQGHKDSEIMKSIAEEKGLVNVVMDKNRKHIIGVGVLQIN